MLAKPHSKFPVKVAEPETIPTGDLFLSDLLSSGVDRVTPKTITRATCTIGTQYRDEKLSGIVVPDHYTAVLEYADGRRYQVEYLLDKKKTTDMTVQKLEDYVREDHWKLLIVAEGPLSRGGTRYCEGNGDVEIIRLNQELSGGPRT
jgi:hypothetical protein